jgi:arginase family enzyme
MAAESSRNPADSISEMLLPRHYGSVPTLFGAPRARTAEDLAGSDLAFLGIPWSAPIPDSRLGAAAANYSGTALTPQAFRTSSVKYGGYLPELDVDVFQHFRLVDYGDSQVYDDMGRTLSDVETRVGEILDAGAIPITMGGNAGPSSYPVLKVIAARASGPAAVVNFDAHHDNMRGEWIEDRAELPRWGSTWARRILDLPGVDPGRYYHVGLRGPRNDRNSFDRFIEKGVDRSHIYTFRHIVAARRRGFEDWAQEMAGEVAAGAAKVWIGLDPDVLDMADSPDFGDEPLGLHTEEVCWLVHELGRALGLARLGGISFMAVPNTATSVHWICIYVLLYALAGMVRFDADNGGAALSNRTSPR